MWFANHTDLDQKPTLQDISDDTGIPPRTVHNILWGRKRYGAVIVKTAGTNDWPLAHIGFRCGYWVTWVGMKKGYIHVRKVKYSEAYY